MRHPRDLDTQKILCLHCGNLVELRVMIANEADPYPVVITCHVCRGGMIQTSEGEKIRPVTPADLAGLRQKHPNEFRAIMNFMHGIGNA